MEGEGLPTSCYATHDAVDFFVAELGNGEVVIVVGDRFGFALRASDGEILSRFSTRFTGRESLDFFAALASPDQTGFVVCSTRQLCILASSGQLLWEEEVSGMLTSCVWTTPNTVRFEALSLHGSSTIEGLVSVSSTESSVAPDGIGPAPESDEGDDKNGQ